MQKYLKQHEDFIRRQLASAGDGTDWMRLARCHRTQIEYLQHERLVHLLVTLFFALCVLVVLIVVIVQPQVLTGVLLLLLLALLVPYIVHYYQLENGVQRWYHLANEIDRRAGVVSEGDGDRSSVPHAR